MRVDRWDRAIDSSGSVTIGATAELNGNCVNGIFYVNAGTTITQLPGSKITANALPNAIGQSGGYFDWYADSGDIVVRGIDAGSGQYGGFINIESGNGAVQVLGAIDNVGANGDLTINACDLYVAKGAKIDARGTTTTTDLDAGETLTIAGNIVADIPVDLGLGEGEPLISGTIKPSFTTNGNHSDCRGPSCTPGGSCGDSTVNCGEECDEGANNGQPGSQCTASCVAVVPSLRIPGGGQKPIDCAAEWVVAIDASDVPLDGKGLPRTSLSCHDGDPTCDFDVAPGRCRFRLWSCLGGADSRLPCSAASVVATSVINPKATSHLGFELAARQSVQAALTALGVPVGPGEACSPRYEIDVAVGQKPLKLNIRGTLGIGPSDTDQLQLSCLP